MKKSIKEKSIWIIIAAVVLTGWIDVALYQDFLSNKYPGSNYHERNFKFIEPEIIIEYSTTAPGVWVTLAFLVFSFLALIAMKHKKEKAG